MAAAAAQAWQLGEVQRSLVRADIQHFVRSLQHRFPCYNILWRCSMSECAGTVLAVAASAHVPCLQHSVALQRVSDCVRGCLQLLCLGQGSVQLRVLPLLQLQRGTDRLCPSCNCSSASPIMSQHKTHAPVDKQSTAASARLAHESHKQTSIHGNSRSATMSHGSEPTAKARGRPLAWPASAHTNSHEPQHHRYTHHRTARLLHD